MISEDVRRAIARAVRAAGLEPVDPGLRPTGTPGRYASSVAFALGERPQEIAAQIAAQLPQAPHIATAEVTGPGFITITVTPEAIAGLPERIAAAGPACATSDALRGVTVPMPPQDDPLAAATWEEARAALAAQLTARLAAAAGATVALPEDMERTVASTDPKQLAVIGEATDRYSAKKGEPPANPQRQETPGRGDGGYGGVPSEEVAWPGGPDTMAVFAIGPAGARTGGYGGSSPRETTAFAGADAVRFALARAVPGRPVRIDPQVIGGHVLGNPAYAVRYAHARAASGVRWAATSREAVTPDMAAVPRRPPADQGELVLLDSLSWLPERVATAARRGRPDEFARYLEELAAASIAVLISAGDPGAARAPGTGRLAMARAARTGLAAGLGLLGVGAPDRL